MLNNLLLILSLLLFFTYSRSQSTNEQLSKDAKLLYEKSNYFSSFDLDSCKFYTQKAEQKYYEAKNWSGNIYSLNSLATLYYYESNYTKYINTMDSVNVLCHKHLNKEDSTYLFVMNNMGAYHRVLGNYTRAINSYQKALLIPNTTLKQKALVLSSLSYSYNLLGDHKKAIKCLNNVDLKKEDKTDFFINRKINYLKALGFSHLSNKQYIVAREIYKEALAYFLTNFDARKNKSRSARLYFDVAKVQLKVSNYTSFREHLNKISELNIDKNSLLQGDISLSLSEFYLITKDLNLAKQSILEAISIYKLINKKELSIYKIRNAELILSEILIKKNEIKKARELLLKNFTDLEKISSYNIKKGAQIYKLKLLNKLTVVSKITKDYSSYNKYISLLKNLIKSLRQQNSSASHKDFWANENLEIYQNAIGTFVEQNDINIAFTFAEENKSNLLIQSLNDIDAKSYAGIPKELLEKEREMRARLQFYQKKKFELENSDDIDSSKLLSYTDVITKTDFAIEAIVDTLESQYPEYFEIKYNVEDLKVKDIQSLIDKETAFIEYFIGKDSSYVFTITKNNIYVSPLKNINTQSSILLKYYKAISDPSTSIDSLNYYSALAYNLVFKDAIKDLSPKYKNLVIVPDDILNNLPFGMMKDSNTDNYIGSKYNIQYQYSGRLWRLLKNRKSENKKYDFLGYAYNTENLNFLAERACATMEVGNLLCSEKEVSSIANILSDKKLNLDINLKDDILKNASDAKVIHLATHSCLDSENSDYSRIFFDDGYITNIDLQLQNIDADLAVLSACESGYGELVKGEGAMSISKGFFHAGCKSTLVSLWPVDDCSTSEFMRHFYTFLKAGDKKDIALKKAKQTYIDTAHPSRTHPYYWAGFILIGDNNPVWSNAGNWSYWVVGLLVLVICFSLLLKKRYSKNIS